MHSITRGPDRRPPLGPPHYAFRLRPTRSPAADADPPPAAHAAPPSGAYCGLDKATGAGGLGRPDRSPAPPP
ncbi:hypothetical protein LT493_44080 [Streptomyces tricolor]|nr:hypothetical protein [Streptomyces tricolor]